MIFSPLSSTAGERKERVEMAVRLKGGSIQPLSKRMARYRVPGVSMAVMNDYQIEWASGYGVRKQGTSDPVDTETLFQACSISKAVTAIAVLRLVSEGRLDLDNDVNSYLRSWKVPRNGSWQPTVTIRELLSHTGGISVPWFAGYHRQQDIPTLRQVLDGAQPSEQGMNFDALLQQVREEIARGFHLAEYAETLLRDSQNWEVICPAQMGIITFRYTREGVSNAQLDALNVGLVDAMIADGYAMFSTAVLRERTVLRFCTINPRTTEQDIAKALRRLERFASKGQPA